MPLALLLVRQYRLVQPVSTHMHRTRMHAQALRPLPRLQHHRLCWLRLLHLRRPLPAVRVVARLVTARLLSPEEALNKRPQQVRAVLGSPSAASALMGHSLCEHFPVLSMMTLNVYGVERSPQDLTPSIPRSKDGTCVVFSSILVQLED